MLPLRITLYLQEDLDIVALNRNFVFIYLNNVFDWEDI